MAPAGASDEEHEQGLAVSVPSASEQQEEEKTEGGDQKAPAASNPYEQKAWEIENGLLRRSIESISAVLEAGAPRGDSKLRVLAFIKMELTCIVSSSLLDNPIDDTLLPWLRKLFDYAMDINIYLRPGSHTLLRRARSCFRNGTGISEVDWFWFAWEVFMLAEHPWRYRQRSLLVPNSYHGQPQPQPTQVDQVGGLHPRLVGIDRPAKKILRWLIPPEADGEKRLRVMAIVGPVGVGKTTLAWEIRSRLIRCGPGGGSDYFQHNVMAQASRGDDRNELLLRDILSQVSSGHGPAPLAL